MVYLLIFNYFKASLQNSYETHVECMCQETKKQINVVKKYEFVTKMMKAEKGRM